MNSTATQPAALRPLLSATARIGAGLAVLALVAGAWLAAESASHEAVASSTQALSRSVTHVTLPPVYIVAQSRGAEVASIRASGVENPSAARPTGL